MLIGYFTALTQANGGFSTEYGFSRLVKNPTLFSLTHPWKIFQAEIRQVGRDFCVLVAPSRGFATLSPPWGGLRADPGLRQAEPAVSAA